MNVQDLIFAIENQDAQGVSESLYRIVGELGGNTYALQNMAISDQAIYLLALYMRANA